MVLAVEILLGAPSLALSFSAEGEEPWERVVEYRSWVFLVTQVSDDDSLVVVGIDFLLVIAVGLLGIDSSPLLGILY